MMFNDKTILLTGGTGSFGKKFTEIVLGKYRPKKLIIFSRDELKQFDMAKKFHPDKYPIRFFLGDIRDRQRLYRAFEGVNYVIHAAALKQVPALEYNPFEAVKTNIMGAENIVDAAIDRGVEKVVALSTDKAVNPANLYGATKLAMEKIFTAASVYSGSQNTSFSLVRYGNVLGSRGSVIPFFLELLNRGEKTLPVTDERMTRFWITLEQGVELVIKALREGVGGEIFIPRIPSMKITELAKALCPDCSCKIVGIRPGEKVHETLISEDEARTTVEEKNGFVILPQFALGKEDLKKYGNHKRVAEGFVYRSDLNTSFLSAGELNGFIREMEIE
ncbi:MAG: UDP-N-acetylglucosamine 4,6-dehydratase (inverting) [Nitrospiraceae bacterium]|nr:UDP-N-acetylglucosamine 4,6-dehydratase (inverting) [Nitrospiraceae bacterium]